MPPFQSAAWIVSDILFLNSLRLGRMANNIILVAGKAYGETAAFQNHLVRYLIAAEKNYSAELVLADGRDSQSIVEAWEDLWSEGKLPAGAGQPKDYAYRVQPLGRHKDKPALNFSFREVSAPDQPAQEASEPPHLEDLGALFKTAARSFVLVLVCDREDADIAWQDELLARLIQHLNDFGEDFVSRCPVLLIVCGEQGAETGVEAFLGENLPDTLAALQDWRGRYTLGELDIGGIERGGGEPLLPSPKFEDMGKIFRWIYFQFTRHPVVEPFITRLWKSVRKSVSLP